MSQEPVTVTYSLEEMFSRLEQKIDSNQKELKQELSQVNQKLDKQSEEITTIKATLQAQQPFLIILNGCLC